MRSRTVARSIAVAAVALALSREHSAISAQSGIPPAVLTVHWGAEDFSGTPIVDEAIRDGVSSSGTERIDYYAEYLESDRFPGEEAHLAFRDYLHRKYSGRRIDVVVANADPALTFLIRYRKDLFPDAPIVFLTSAAPTPELINLAPGMTGLYLRNVYEETLALALKLHPAAEQAFIVAQSAEPRLRSSVAADLARFSKRVALTYFEGDSASELLAAVKALPVSSLVLYIRFSQEAAGNVLFPPAAAKLVAESSPVPVYGISDAVIGSGVVGGVVRGLRVNGRRAGEMARQIVLGKRALDIPIERTPMMPTFDWRQLRRWGIAESALPAGSVVQFRETSIWERYRTPIVLTASVLLLQSALIAGLVVERRRRRRAELESRRNLAAMAHLDRRAAMGELATSLAHELNQPLNAILQNAGMAHILLTSDTLPSKLEEMPDIISDIRKDNLRASEIIRRMRGLLQKHELESHPVDLNDVVQDTVAIVRPDAQSRQIQLEVELAEGVRPILGDRVHLQQVLLNLLMNAIDAVAAMPPERRRVRVSTTASSGGVRLAVTDSGVGIHAGSVSKIFEPFYTTKTGGSGMGMGLAIARSIVEAHEGHMAAENNTAGGATVWFSVPMSPGPHA